MAQKVAFDVNFAIIGIESQETTDHSLPLRNMLYDVAEYEKQAAKIRRKVRKEKNGLSPGEYLYGFTKNSKLFPVITFVLYTGEDDWDGPLCLHDMLDFTNIPEELQAMIPNYEINVISVKDIEDTSMFQTDLRHVLDFLRLSKSKKELVNLVENDPYYQSMEEDAYDVVANYANAEKIVDKKEYYIDDGGKMNMCTAIRELMEDSKLEGFIKALQTVGQSPEQIVEKLCDNFDITPEDARKQLEQLRH